MTPNIKRARLSPKYGKRGIKASSNGYKCKNEKRGGKKDKSMNSFNYGKSGHFSHDCIRPKVMFNQNHPSNVYISCLTEYVLFWTIDSIATDHIARDRTAFMEFHRIPKNKMCMCVWNNASTAVIGIGTCKLDLQGGHTLYLHDVLHALEV